MNLYVYMLHIVNFLISGNFCFFLLFLGMEMYANEVDTKENKNYPRQKKINYKIYIFIIFSNQSATEEDADENEKEIVDIVMKKMVS